MMLLSRALAIALFGLVGCILVSCTTTKVDDDRAAAARRPNVVFLFTDDQRYDTIHALGDERIVTPSMDRLAAQGFAFTNAYVMGSMHGAVCMPSRAMLLTGRPYFHLPASVTETWSVPAAERGRCPYVTFPEVFREAGYETFATGKWHNGRRLLARGFTDGGSIFFGGMSDHLAVPVHDFDPEGLYDAGTRRKGASFSSELFTDEAVAFLETRATDDPPFLLYVSYTAPHDPRMAPPEYAALYPPDSMTLPENFLPEHPFPIGDLRVRDERLAPMPRTPEVVREHLAAYYAMITHLDAQIGRILDAIARTGRSDDTIIVLAGDNGLAVGQHGLLGKQNVYEHSAKVPLVIAGPGIPAGGRSEALCYVHDLFPTLCGLAGLPVPASVESESLVPILRGTADSVRDSILLAYSSAAGGKVDGVPQPPGHLRAVRRGNWKLIVSSYDGHERELLFDLASDPWERRDLSADSEPGATRRIITLASVMKEWMAQLGDAPDW